jgi:hypothetical protein
MAEGREVSETQDQRKERQDRIAQAAMPGLDELADQLEAIAGELFDKRIAYEPDDGADVMALSFVTKQREHLRSARTLVAAGLHRDALLIARTMIEGLGRLLWAFNRTPERTDLWLWFGTILDWRQTLKNEEAGMEVDPGEKGELKSYVDKHGPNYYRPSVRKGLETAQRDGSHFEIPEDPWAKDWTDASIETMFGEVGGKSLYERAYRNSSEWLHWNPRSILRAMQSAEWGVDGFTQEDWRAAATALQLACQSLLQSLQVLDQHFSTGNAERLSELATTMQTTLDEALAAGG